jgi:3-methyladenine DNA glycosylase AlkC
MELKLVYGKVFQQYWVDLLESFGVSAKHTTSLNLDPYELKDRVRLSGEALFKDLNQDFSQFITFFWDTVPPDFSDHIGVYDYGKNYAHFSSIIESYGVPFPEESAPLIEKLTKMYTSEFCIRPFLVEYPDLYKQKLAVWKNSKNFHVRRMTTEGTRPGLPWATRLRGFMTAKESLHYLYELKEEKHPYVRKSIANHLNDLSKIEEDTCLDFFEKNPVSPSFRDVILHGFRSLLKKNHPRALNLLGFAPCTIQNQTLAPLSESYSIGEKIKFNTVLDLSQKQKVKGVLYFHFPDKQGAMSRCKEFVFPAKETDQCRFLKTIDLQQMSTRTYYPGPLLLELFLNGQKVATQKSVLLA